MRQNIHELPDLVRLAHRLAINEVFVQHLCHDFQESSLPAQYRPMRNFVTSETLTSEDPERVQRLFDEARGVARELGVDLRLPRTRPRLHPPGTPGPQRCDWPWRGAYVSYQGLAMPCCMVATPDRIQLGSMAERGAWPSGTARTTRPSAISSRRITRRKSAGRARSTRGRFEPPGEARDRGGLSVSARAEVGTARPRHRVIGTVRLLQSARACCTLGEAMTDQATCRDTHREDRRPRWPGTGS